MRDYLNGILSFIGATSLTDPEFDTIDIDDQGNSREVYEALLLILDARSMVGNRQERLRCYFFAKGISFDKPKKSLSNIFVGGDLG